MLWHQTGNSQGNYTYNAYIYDQTKYRPHFHKNYELLYVLEGVCLLTVPTGTYRLTAGQLFLVPPYAVHSFEPEEAYRLWVGVFSADHISRYADTYSDSLYGPFRCEEALEIFLQPRLFVPGKKSGLDTAGYLSLVCDQCLKHGELLATMHFERINNIADVVTQHITEDITLRQVAEELNYEYHYFSRLFHRMFSMNFRQFVNLHKVEAACRLLRQTEMDITQIALDCGFQTVRSFNRVFKDHTGQTPSQFRQEATAL